MTLERSFSPLWEQLSMLTMAMGVPPALNRSSSRAAVMLMAWEHLAWTKGKNSPWMFCRA